MKKKYLKTTALVLAGLVLSGCSAVSSQHLEKLVADGSLQLPEAHANEGEHNTQDGKTSGDSSITGVTPAQAKEALGLLQDIEIKGRAPKTGYSRDQFSSGWKDPDRNGCDARNDILARDLTDVEYKPAPVECVVLSGTFNDPYTGKTIEFTRGQGTSSEVQIDHVVALSDAWQKGAQLWSAEKRLEFANDPLNLLASDGPANASKSDKDAATWLPPNRGFRCAYVARQTQVKAKYEAWMTKAENQAIKAILKRCL